MYKRQFTSIVACPAPAGGTWTGLSIDPTTNVFYASTGANLYTLNPITCSPTLIGPFNVTGGIMIDIAVNPAGVMYGHDIFTDSIYTINTSTGAATLVGLTGYLANFAQGMDFDNEDGTLYIFLYVGTGVNHYGTVNLTTGAVTALASTNPTGEFEGATQTLGLCIPNDYGWLSTSPISGTTAANSVTPVTVTFDSTAWANGVYTGQLCIRSNDPDNGPGNETSLVQVPVTLTVEAVTVPNIDVSPLSLSSAQAPNTTTTQPLNVGNTGGSALTWSIFEDVSGSPDMVDWSDTFDSYATGSQIHGQGGWKGWANDPSAGALASSAQARSVPNSAAIVGASDLVHEYSGYTSGPWVYTAWQYAPTDMTGVSYFILLNQYDDAGATNNLSLIHI